MRLSISPRRLDGRVAAFSPIASHVRGLFSPAPRTLSPRDSAILVICMRAWPRERAPRAPSSKGGALSTTPRGLFSFQLALPDFQNFPEAEPSFLGPPLPPLPSTVYRLPSPVLRPPRRASLASDNPTVHKRVKCLCLAFFRGDFKKRSRESGFLRAACR